MSFDKAFQSTFLDERGYSNNPNDPGGKTRYGVTEAVARAHRYTGDMKDLPLSFAKHVWRSDYWDAINLDAVDAKSERVADKLFNAGINLGPETVAPWIQRVLNAMNGNGTDYPDIRVDGKIGKKTIGAFDEYLKRYAAYPAVPVMLKALNSLQGEHYLHLAEANRKLETFTFGWFNKRIDETD
jgi:lysozyme family protein